MVNILIVSHGPLADAFRESLEMFFGKDAETVSTLGLYPMDNPESLQEKIVEKVKEIDDGDGVLILVDIPNATPYNQTALAISEMGDTHKVECLSGISMPLLMEACVNRSTMSVEELKDHLLENVAPTTVQDLRKSLDF
jgi:PTS system mannose-specific IIA component